VVTQTAGLSLQVGAVGVDARQTWQSREFKAGKLHRWNFISLIFLH
jgi:ligand-binding SRPBCC domain-containing protein